MTIYDVANDQSLTGSTGDDVFHGGAGGTDLIEISQGGSDRIVWATTVNDMTIDAFSTAALLDGGDILDFSNLGLHQPNHTPGGIEFQTFNSNGDPSQLTPASDKVSSLVLGLTDLTANTALGIQTMFTNYQQRLNTLVDGHSDMVFLIANQEDAQTNVWHWVDAGGFDGTVQAGELFKPGTINNFGMADIAQMGDHSVII